MLLARCAELNQSTGSMSIRSTHFFEQNWGQTYSESNRILSISHRNHHRIHRW